jgi:hypothetical protein
MKAFAASLAALFLSAGAASAQYNFEDIQRGVRDGLQAGREASLLMPVFAGGGTAAALALTDGAELTNNHIVSALVVNSALSVAATWVSSLILPPRPSREDRQMLTQQTPLYAQSWHYGFRQTSANRRFSGKLLGSFGGVVIGIAIYASRAK